MCVCVCVCMLLLFYHTLVEVLVKLFVQRACYLLMLLPTSPSVSIVTHVQ
jgi:hypothetical protein